jgi:hypothetical protein
VDPVDLIGAVLKTLQQAVVVMVVELEVPAEMVD